MEEITEQYNSASNQKTKVTQRNNAQTKLQNQEQNTNMKKSHSSEKSKQTKSNQRQNQQTPSPE